MKKNKTKKNNDTEERLNIFVWGNFIYGYNNKNMIGIFSSVNIGKKEKYVIRLKYVLNIELFFRYLREVCELFYSFLT